MAQSLGAMMTQAGDRLNDANHARFPQPLLRRWINEGCRELVRKTECLFGQDSIVVVAGTQSYSLPANTVRINHVQYEASGQVYALEFIERGAAQWRWGTNQTSQSAYPEQFSTWGHPGSTNLTVYLYPVPSTAGLLRVWYARLPTELSTTGSADGLNIDVPNGWEDAVLDYVMANAYLRDRRPEEYQLMMQRFQDRLLALAETANRNYDTNPGMILPLEQFDDWGNW